MFRVVAERKELDAIPGAQLSQEFLISADQQCPGQVCPRQAGIEIAYRFDNPPGLSQERCHSIGISLLRVPIAQRHAGRAIDQDEGVRIDSAVHVAGQNGFQPDNGEQDDHRGSQTGHEYPRARRDARPRLSTIQPEGCVAQSDHDD